MFDALAATKVMNCKGLRWVASHLEQGSYRQTSRELLVT
jgi:hypothetical protein